MVDDESIFCTTCYITPYRGQLLRSPGGAVSGGLRSVCDLSAGRSRSQRLSVDGPLSGSDGQLPQGSTQPRRFRQPTHLQPAGQYFANGLGGCSGSSGSDSKANAGDDEAGHIREIMLLALCVPYLYETMRGKHRDAQVDARFELKQT